MYESISIIDQSLDRMKKEKEGEIETVVKEIPEGMGTGRAEAPRGEVFHFVKTNGSNYPVRHKIRAPSYVNIATFRKSCIGQTITDATLSLAAVDPCYCCTERLAVVYDIHSGDTIMNGKELIELSAKRTSALKS
jgi:NADH-quinone oxidoreductase subunit D